MNLHEKRTVGDLLACAILVLSSSILVFCIRHGIDDTVYYIGTVCLICVALSLYEILKYNAVYVLALAYGATLICINPYFAPIDEMQHFANVRHIAERGKLPLLYDMVDDEVLAMDEHVYPRAPSVEPSSRGLAGKMYEAFQAPLYYIVAAGLYLIAPGDLIAKLYALRAAGLLGVLISIFFTCRIYEVLVSEKVLERDDYLFFSLVSLVLLTPGFLVRMTTIGNVNLLVPLATVFFYTLTKLTFVDSEMLGFRHVFLFSVFLSLLMMTKITAVFLAAVGVALVLYKIPRRKFLSLLIFSVVILHFMAPWFLFNMRHYGELTASSQARNMQQHVANPYNENFGAIHVLERTSLFLASFWYPEEGRYPLLRGPNTMFVHFLSTWLLLCLLLLLNRTAGPDRRLTSRDSLFVQSVAVSSILLNMTLLVLVTTTQFVSIMLGRFLYLNVSMFVLLFFIATWECGEGARKHFPFVYIAMQTFLTTNFLALIAAG